MSVVVFEGGNGGAIVFSGDAVRVDDAASAIAAAAAPYPSRAAAIAATIHDAVIAISILHGGSVLQYVYDPAGTALTTAGGRKWSPNPAGMVWLEHWGVVTSATKGGATVDYTSQVQAAMNWTEGELLFSGWVKITDKVVCPNRCRLRVPEGRGNGGFAIRTDFNLAASCVLQPGTSEPGATIDDFGMWAEQPADPANRAALIAYPPAIDIGTVAIPRGIITSLRLEGFIDGIVGVGNCGGYRFGILELGCFGKNIHLDGGLDFIHAESIHVWPFGSAGNSFLTDIFYDGTTEAGRFGRLDNFVCDKFSTFRAKLVLDDNTADRLPCTFNSVGLDGDGARLILGKGTTQINNLYSTKTSTPTVADIVCGGGTHYISNISMTGGSSVSVSVTAGDLTISNGRIYNNDSAKKGAEVTGGRLLLENLALEWPATARTAPFVHQVGGQLSVKDCTAVHAVVGEIVRFDVDNLLNQVDGASLSPHTITYNPEWLLGRYGSLAQSSMVTSGVANHKITKVATGEGPEVGMMLARGTLSAPTTVANADILGDLAFFGHDGTSFSPSAYLRSRVAGAVSTGIVPGQLAVILRSITGTLVEALSMSTDAVVMTPTSLSVGGVTGFKQTKFIADDAVGTFTLPAGRTTGFAVINVGLAEADPVIGRQAMFYFHAGTTLAIVKNTGFAGVGGSVDVTTSNVTGITGVDGNITVSVQAGVIKVENRLGNAQNVAVTVL